MKLSRLVTIAVVSMLVVTPAFAKPAKKKQESAGLCSLAHYPIAVGDISEYRTTSTQFDGEKKVVATNISTYSEEVIAVDDDGYRVKTVSEANTSESRWGCSAEGIALKYDDYPNTTITATGMTYPATMEVGGSWNQVFEMVSPDVDIKLTTVNRITKREMVTVPIGTFEAFRVDFEVATSLPEQPPSVNRGTQWFVTDVGLVKTSSVVDLVAGDIRSIETTNEMVKRTTKK